MIGKYFPEPQVARRRITVSIDIGKALVCLSVLSESCLLGRSSYLLLYSQHCLDRDSILINCAFFAQNWLRKRGLKLIIIIISIYLSCLPDDFALSDFEMKRILIKTSSFLLGLAQLLKRNCTSRFSRTSEGIKTLSLRAREKGGCSWEIMFVINLAYASACLWLLKGRPCPRALGPFHYSLMIRRRPRFHVLESYVFIYRCLNPHSTRVKIISFATVYLDKYFTFQSFVYLL